MASESTLGLLLCFHTETMKLEEVLCDASVGDPIDSPKFIAIRIASTRHIRRITSHLSSISAQPFIIMRIMDDTLCDDFACVPVPGGFTGYAIHLRATRALVNKLPTTRTGLRISPNHICRRQVICCTGVRSVRMLPLYRKALTTAVMLTDATLPCGAQESLTVGLHTATNKLFLLFFPLFIFLVTYLIPIACVILILIPLMVFSVSGPTKNQNLASLLINLAR